MRRLLFLFIVLLLFMFHAPAYDATDPTLTNATVYANAIANLQQGHDFAQCVQQLQYLTAQDDTNRRYHLALGCAEADCVASLGYAALFTRALGDERAKYAQSLAKWQTAQADPKSDTFGDARPTLPPLRTFVTKDDLHPFLLTPAQAAAQINSLIADAQVQWRRALALSHTPDSRAEAEYVQGWGLQMLRLLAIGNNGAQQKPPFAVPAVSEAVRAFTTAVRDAPDKAVYWQSLGDAQYNVQIGSVRIISADALASYEKSVALQPQNAALWYRIYEARFPRYGRGNPADKNIASAILKHVIGSDPSNAFPRYLLAETLFKQTHFSDPHDKIKKADQAAALNATYDAAQQTAADNALLEIETANSKPRCEEIVYQSPYPSLLTGYGVWASFLRTFTNNLGEYAKFREIARACGGYARIKAAQGDAAGLQRGARACIGMGLKLAGDWPSKDAEPGDGSLTAALVGIAVTGIGYSDLVKSEQQIGNRRGQQKAQAEYDAFKQRRSEYSKLVQKNLKDFSPYDDY